MKDLVEVKCNRCKKVHYFPGIHIPNRAKLFAVLSDESGMIVNATASVKTALGKHISQLVGTPVRALFVDEKDALSDETIAARALHHKYMRLDACIQTQRVSHCEVTVSYTHVEQNRQNFVLRAFDEASGVSENELKKLGFDSSNICPCICEADGTGIIQYVSGSVENIFGYRPEEVVGRHVSEFHAADEISMRTKYRDFFASRALTYRQKNHVLITKGGERLLFEIHATPLHDHTGEFIGYKNMVWPE